MKKAIGKKLIGGLMVSMLIATIGAVLVSAESDSENENFDVQHTFWPQRRSMCGEPPFISDLTVEQRQEIEDIVTSLKEEGATKLEISEAISSKLEEYGIEIQKPELSEEELDERLDQAIEYTERKLEILNRVKELRDQGYGYEDIRTIIQDEFELEFPAGEFQGNMCRHRYRRGSW